jgi:uncharacterized protein YbjQ (UPF0145 family)
MPLFGRRRDAAGATSGAVPGAAPDRARADQEALARGEIPPSVRERLERERGRQLPWTSTLSVADWAVGRGHGFVPVGQVMGSSLYHTGWAFAPGWQSGELAGPTRAAHAVRTLALERMRQEAVALGAHGVIAVRLVRRAYDWGEDLIEFTAIGTAVRLDAAAATPAPARPFLAGVDGADLARLLAVGYLPVGVALGVSVAYLYTDWTSMAQQASWANQEMAAFTDATYAVRRLAAERLRQAAAADGADGVIAYDTALTVRPVEVGGGGGGERTDHILEFVAVGTAVARIADRGGAAPVVPILPLRDPPPPAVAP